MAACISRVRVQPLELRDHGGTGSESLPCQGARKTDSAPGPRLRGEASPKEVRGRGCPMALSPPSAWQPSPVPAP